MTAASSALQAPHRINGHTQLCVIIGDPVAHSLSPAMHNAAYRALGIDEDFVYVAAHVAPQDLPAAVAGFRAMGLRGLTCTIPHKQTILPLLDEIDPIAAKIGAVNTVVHEEGKLIGYNTDWQGIVLPLQARIDLTDKSVLLLGAGGTARSAGFGLQQAGAQVTICNRHLGRGQALAQVLEAKALPWQERETALHHFDIIINTTSVGMAQPEQSPLPGHALQSSHLVFDAIYTPFETRLLRDAKARGAQIVRGAQMFLAQGLAQFEHYTDHRAPTEVMEAVICTHFSVTALDDTATSR